MATKSKKRGKGKNKTVAQYLRPTPEREAANDFRSAGMAMRVVPVIVRLHEAKVLSDREYAALAYYRDQASLADRSPMRSCCDFSPRGGHGPGVEITSAVIETGRLERGMGALSPLVRAIAVDDMTLAQWCVQRHGTPAGSLAPHPHHLGIATLELKYAAGGIVRS